MRLEPEQLARLARLTDEWLDLSEGARRAWLAAAMREQSDLAPALLAMTAERVAGDATGIDPLSLPALDAAAADDDGGHRAGDEVGPYRLVSLLGRGGMGAVWLADQVDGRVQRKVALKLPLPGLAQGNWRRRFERERDILAALDHPGIAKLFDAGVAPEGQPYLAMQYVDGLPLTRFARAHGLSLAARVRMFVELLGVVQHSHAALVAHRDLKPSNILVDEQGRVMLLDFGIAKLLGDRGPKGLADATEFAGPGLTLDYASPEQVAGHALGTGTDIYSLGIVLYELLAGQRPYRLRRASRAEIEEAVLEQEVAPPSGRVVAEQAQSMSLGKRALARQLRGDLDAIVLKALRKKIEHRYPTAQAFDDDLNRWLRKEPVRAQPDSVAYRLRRFMARSWRLVAAGASIAAVLLAATVVALLQARDARSSDEAARHQARQAEAVTAFLQDLFLNNSVRQADPEAARKRTAEQLMDDAASRIGVALADAPEQQIALLHKMAQTYQEMRLPERAQALARQAADVAAQVYGPDQLNAKHEEAFWMLVSAANGQSDHLDPPSPALVQSLAAMAASPNKEENRLALRVCRAMMERDFVLRAESAMACADLSEPLIARLADDDDSLDLHHIMGVVYLQNLRFQDAARHFGAARSMQAAKGLGAANNESLPTWQGRLEALAGNYVRAESLMRAGYAMERHNDAGGERVNDWGLASLATLLANTGRAAEGLSLAQTGGPLASPQARSKLASSVRSMFAQSHALARLGRGEEALAKAEQAELHFQKADDGERAPPTQLMEALLVSGRADEAMALVNEQEPRIALARASISGRLISEFRIRCLIAKGHPREAREYLESRRTILAPLGSGPAEAARLAWLDVGLALLEGRPAEARSVADAGLQRLAQAGPDAQIYLRDWQARLNDRMGDADLALGDAAGARAAYEAAMSAYAQVADPTYSMAMGRVAMQLAHLAHNRGDAANAKRLRAQADAIAARHPRQQGWGA